MSHVHHTDEKILSYKELTVKCNKMLDLLLVMVDRPTKPDEPNVYISQCMAIICMWGNMLKGYEYPEYEQDKEAMLSKVMRYKHGQPNREAAAATFH